MSRRRGPRAPWNLVAGPACTVPALPAPPRRIPLLALMVAFTAIGTGCGDGESSPAADASSPAAKAASRATPASPKLRSRGDLRPPVADIRRSEPGQAPGLIFITPKKVFGAKRVPGAQGGPEIIDARGRVRYFKPNSDGDVANDFRVQTYRGKPVLTYWYGRQIKGTGKGVGVIYDERYRRIATVRAGNGLRADFHEFKLTDRGTALIIAYRTTTSEGKKVVEGVVQEIEIAGGKVLTEWRSLDDVPVSESYEPEGARSSKTFDYIHLNSVALDSDGNLLASARHTWALYKIERGTGKLLWTLGGKGSDFKMGKGTQTAWQHDAISEGDGVIRVFDNAAGDKTARKLLPYSRVVRLKVDAAAKTVALLSSRKHPDDVSAGTQGNGQALPGGGLFVGWGSQGIFSEFSADGKMLFDARVPRGNDTYRAYKSEWTGVPSEKPRVAARLRGKRIVVDASWNGSTEVRAWRARTGRTAGALRPAGRTPWKNLETSFGVPAGDARYVAVEALDASGKVLSTSPARRVAR